MKKLVLFTFLLLIPFIGFCEDEAASGEKTPEKKVSKEATSDEMTPVVIDGDEVSYLTQEGKIVAKGNVKFKYKDLELYCEEAIFDANTNVANIIGDVKIIRGEAILYGKDIVYDFNTFNVDASAIRMRDAPFYGVTNEGSKIGQGRYVLKNGYVTTCDLAEPHYRLTSKRITVYPGDRMVARGVVFKVGKIPMMYFPYVSQSLKDESFMMNIVPGDDKKWGTFILTRWRYNASLRNRGNIFTDWYDKRGLGLGITHKSTNDKFGQALVKYYGIEDYLYKLEERYALASQYPERAGQLAKRLEDDRYKGQISYSWSHISGFSIRGELHKFSDENFMKDFFELEHKSDPKPLSYVLARYSLLGGSTSLLMQKRVNRFFSETEYLPQLEYNFFSQVIGLSRFYFKSDNKIGNLNKPPGNAGGGDDTLRIHSHNVLDRVLNVRWLHLKPYVGYFSTFYHRNSTGGNNIVRLTPEFGTTMSTKLYKYFNPKNLNILGEKIDQMRHIITPEIEYKYKHEPTFSRSRATFSFDTEDSIGREEQVVLTLKNKIQAKNSQRSWDFIYFSPSTAYTIDPEGSASGFASVTADFEIYPKDGVSLTTNTSYSTETRRLTAFNADLTYEKKNKVFEGGEEVEKTKYVIIYGHRYSRQRSTQGTLDFTYHLTPKLQLKAYTRYEFNTEDFEDQQYKVRADLHCWWLDFGVRYRLRPEGSKDVTFWAQFVLKAFPDISFDIDQGREGAKKVY